MASLVKKWNDGGSLSITYDGNKTGTAVFSSNETVFDRNTKVTFVGADKRIERNVIQKGLYTRLEYIRNNGTKYIDTGYKPNQNTRVVMDAQMMTTEIPNAIFFGTRYAANVRTYMFFYQKAANVFLCDFGATSNGRVTFDEVGRTDRLLIDFNNSSIIVNGVSKAHTATEYQSEYNLYLFAGNLVGTPSWFNDAKLFSCKIYDNGKLVRDFIPCKNSSQKEGLYDTVSKAFFPLIEP